MTIKDLQNIRNCYWHLFDDTGNVNVYRAIKKVEGRIAYLKKVNSDEYFPEM